MGADLTIEPVAEAMGEPVGRVRARASSLRGTRVAGELALRAIDEIPALAVAAASAEGQTTFADLAELRIKESDRIAALARESGGPGRGCWSDPTITTAEHAIALMFALARQLPEADAQTQAGKWPKNAFMGVEVTGKTLGLIGAGNIGSIVASRALGLRMKVIAYDPFLTAERAVEMGVEKVDLETLVTRADFITLHTPLTDETRNILSRERLEDQEGRAHRQLRARRADRRGGAQGGARYRPHRRRRARRVRGRAAAGRPSAVRHARTSSARRTSAPRPAKRRSTSRCRWPSRSATIWSPAASPTRSTCRRSAPRKRRKLKPYMALAEKLGSLVGQLARGSLPQDQHRGRRRGRAAQPEADHRAPCSPG